MPWPGGCATSQVRLLHAQREDTGQDRPFVMPEMHRAHEICDNLQSFVLCKYLQSLEIAGRLPVIAQATQAQATPRFTVVSPFRSKLFCKRL